MNNFDLPRRSYVWSEINKRNVETTNQPEKFESPENFVEVSTIGKDENGGLNYHWVRKILGFYLILVGIGLVGSLFFG